MILSRRNAKRERALLPGDGMRVFDFLISRVPKNARHFVLASVEHAKWYFLTRRTALLYRCTI